MNYGIREDDGAIDITLTRAEVESMLGQIDSRNDLGDLLRRAAETYDERVASRPSAEVLMEPGRQWPFVRCSICGDESDIVPGGIGPDEIDRLHRARVHPGARLQLLTPYQP